MQSANCKLQSDGKQRLKSDARAELGPRAKTFALRIIRLFASLPKSGEAQVIGRQLLRSGTSIGAQYCEAECARSLAEFVSKLGGARQEAKETSYWLEILAESGIVKKERLAELYDESKQLLAMLTASINTAKRRKS